MTAVTHVIYPDLVVELRPATTDPAAPPTAVLLVNHREVAMATVAPGRFAATSADDVLMAELPGLFRRWLQVDSR